MAQIPISEAARLVKRDRKTLYSAIKTGRLTATVSATGDKQIDTAELARVYGPLNTQNATKQDSRMSQGIPQNETLNATDATIELLRAEVANLKARLEDKDKHLDDLRTSLRLLEDKTKPGWRLFGRK